MSTSDQSYTPLSQAAALAGLPMLLEKLRRLTRDAEMLKAGLYGAALQLDAVAEGLGIQPLQGQPAVTIQLELAATESAAAEQLVDLLQHQYPGMSTDDCLNDIFTAGLTTMAHRIIPAETGEEHF